MNPAVQSALEAVNLRNEPAIYYATINAANIFKTSLIIVISDSHIFIFNLNGKAKQILSFYEMTGMTVEDQKITFKFEKSEYSIISQEPNAIVECVFDVLKHVLTHDEQHKLIITNFRVENQKNNGLSALFRLKEIYKNPVFDNFKLMETALMCCQPCVAINQFSDQANFLPHFINILPFCPYIKSVLFTQIDGIDNYEYLTQLSQNELYLKHLCVYGPATTKFAEFIRVLQANKNSHLFGIGFADSNLNTSHLSQISELIKINGLKSVEFHNAIENEVMTSFYSTFLSSGIFDSVYMMNFSGTNNLNLSQLFPEIKQIKILCLSNCGLEIHDIISQLSILSELKTLDISKNHCSNIINFNDPISLPPLLDSINVSSTDFGPGCIVPFLKFLFSNFENGLKLSIGSIAPTESLEWTNIFSYINRCTFRSLVSLSWDNNVVHPKLFTFLLKNPYFKSLSLNSCTGRGAATDIISAIALFIQSSKSLVSLSLRGDGNNYIGSNLDSLFSYIQDSETLESLDITYSRCGDAGYNQVTTFLNKCSKLKHIVIDGMRPKSAEPLFNLAKLNVRIKKDIKVSYPYNDIEKLFTSGILTKRGLTQMRRYFEIDEGSSSYFLRPFRVYRYFLFDEFPYYLSDEEIRDLLSERPLLVEVPPPLPQETEKSSQQTTRTEILDLDNTSGHRRRIFNYSYAQTPNPTVSVWNRDINFSKSMPASAISAPVSPIGGPDSFGDYYRRAGIFDEPIRRIRSPRNLSESRQRVLKPKINVIVDPDEERRQRRGGASSRSRSVNSSPKDNNTRVSKSTRNRRVRDEEENEEENEERETRRSLPRDAKTAQTKSRRRAQRENNQGDDEDFEENNENESRRSSTRKKESPKSATNSKRSKRTQIQRNENNEDDDEIESAKRKIKSKASTPSSRRSRTPTTSTRRSRKEVENESGDEEATPKKSPVISKRRRIAQTPNSSNRRSSSHSNSRRKQNEGEDFEEYQIVETRTVRKTTTKRRIQKND